MKGCGHKGCAILPGYPNKCLYITDRIVHEEPLSEWSEFTISTKLDAIIEKLDYLKYLENLDTTFMTEFDTSDRIVDKAYDDIVLIEDFIKKAKASLDELQRIRLFQSEGFTDYVCLDDVFSVLDEIKLHKVKT